MKLIPIIALVLMFLALFSRGQIGNDANPTASPFEMAKQAYSARDTEKIREICANLSLQGYLVVLLSNEPESPWKEEVILALLESRWPADRQPNKPAPPGINPPLRSIQLAAELLSPVLPMENLKLSNGETYRKLSSLEGRLRLAENFREARKKQGTKGEGSHQSRVDHTAPAISRTPPGNDFTSFPDAEQSAAPPAKEHDTKSPARQSYIFTVVIALLILGSSAILLKRWRRKSERK